VTSEQQGDADDFLTEMVRRAPLFEALGEQALDLNELENTLSVSRSTIHRTTESLDDQGVIRKANGTFELTGFGETVADELDQFRLRVDAARKLAPFLNTVDVGWIDVPVECFGDAETTEPKPRQPHFGVKRIIDLIEAADSLRMFSSIISPFYVDVVHREMMEGMEIEVIFDSDIVEIIEEEYAREAREVFETGRFEVQVHEDVPFELFLFDDRLGMAAHDASGIPRAFVETDSGGAIEWGETVYERYRREASDASTLLA
jgi:predicted transcriptional regulator